MRGSRERGGEKEEMGGKKKLKWMNEIIGKKEKREKKGKKFR